MPSARRPPHPAADAERLCPAPSSPAWPSACRPPHPGGGGRSDAYGVGTATPARQPGWHDKQTDKQTDSAQIIIRLFTFICGSGTSRFIGNSNTSM
jgi:hypothetical protein